MTIGNPPSAGAIRAARARISPAVAVAVSVLMTPDMIEPPSIMIVGACPGRPTRQHDRFSSQSPPRTPRARTSNAGGDATTAIAEGARINEVRIATIACTMRRGYHRLVSRTALGLYSCRDARGSVRRAGRFARDVARGDQA